MQGAILPTRASASFRLTSRSVWEAALHQDPALVVLEEYREIQDEEYYLWAI